jgi:hypothetical protein
VTSIDRASAPPVSHVRLSAASLEQGRSGLIGYLAFHYGGLQLDGVTLRVTARGRPTLTFPSRRDRAGREHPFVRPVDQTARAQIEAAGFVPRRARRASREHSIRSAPAPPARVRVPTILL